MPLEKTLDQRRQGDTVTIPGDYQLRALTQGPPSQRFWHHAKRLLIDRYLPPRAEEFVLDVGCGSGVIAAYLGQSPKTRVLGIDANPEAVTFADYRFAAANIAFRQGYVDEELCADASADKAYCLEVIEHMPLQQGRRLLTQMHRALRRGGRALITTPNYSSFWPVIEWAMDVLKLAPRMKDDQHVEHYSRRKLARLCRQQGFRVLRCGTTCFLAPWLAQVSW
jgi:2-polyprenyl-3-methyl-5-hydroxy-6-metoxy-1,4-benzoquinol methylase